MPLAVDMWKVQQLWGLAALVLFFSWNLWKRTKIDKFIIFMYVYFSCMCLYIGTAIAMLQILMFFLLYAFFNKKYIYYVFYVICTLLLGDVIWFDLGNNYGLFNATTFDNCIMAVMIPWLIFSEKSLIKYFVAVLFALSIFSLHSRTGMLIIGMCALAQCYRSKSWKLLLFILICAALFCTQEWSMLTNFPAGGRIDQWYTYGRIWLENDYHWLGTGLGTFEELTLQMPVNGVFFRHAHNDYLQMLYETGIIGLSVFVLFTGYVFYRARESFLQTTMILAYFIASMFYFPMHFFLSQLILILNLVMVLK